MSDTPSTDFDAQIAQLQAQILASAGGTTQTNELLPTPIGVPKYKVTEQGDIEKYPAGTKGPNGEDLSGKPVPWYAEAQPGTQVQSPWGATSRIEPGSPAAQAGLQVRPKYWSHDAWTLVDAMSSEDVYGVQRQLIDSGLLNPKGVVAGNWTNNEAAAFQQVLSTANQSGVTWDVALSHMAANGRANPKPQTQVQRPALEVHKANPFALGQVADSVSQQLLGRKLNDAERGRFVQWWGQQEDAANAEKAQVAQTEANDLMPQGGDQAGGGIVDVIRGNVLGAPPSETGSKTRVGVHTLHDQMTPDQAAEEYIRQSHGGEVNQTAQVKVMNDFLNILQLQGLGGGIPNRPGG